MTKPVIILGAGGHAKVIINALQLTGKKILGIVSPEKPEKSLIALGVDFLGDDKNIFDHGTDEIELVNGIGSLPSKVLRSEIYSLWVGRGYRFASCIHPSAIISADVQLAKGCQVMAGAIIQPGSSIGENSIINTGAIIDHDCNIGRNCHLAPGVTLSGGVVIRDNTHVGTGASVIQSVVIGYHSVVGAGAVITKDVKDRHIVYSARPYYRELD